MLRFLCDVVSIEFIIVQKQHNHHRQNTYRSLQNQCCLQRHVGPVPKAMYHLFVSHHLDLIKVISRGNDVRMNTGMEMVMAAMVMVMVEMIQQYFGHSNMIPS